MIWLSDDHEASSFMVTLCESGSFSVAMSAMIQLLENDAPVKSFVKRLMNLMVIS